MSDTNTDTEPVYQPTEPRYTTTSRADMKVSIAEALYSPRCEPDSSDSDSDDDMPLTQLLNNPSVRELAAAYGPSEPEYSPTTPYYPNAASGTNVTTPVEVSEMRAGLQDEVDKCIDPEAVDAVLDATNEELLVLVRKRELAEAKDRLMRFRCKYDRTLANMTGAALPHDMDLVTFRTAYRLTVQRENAQDAYDTAVEDEKDERRFRKASIAAKKAANTRRLKKAKEEETEKDTRFQEYANMHLDEQQIVFCEARFAEAQAEIESKKRKRKPASANARKRARGSMRPAVPPAPVHGPYMSSDALFAR